MTEKTHSRHMPDLEEFQCIYEHEKQKTTTQKLLFICAYIPVKLVMSVAHTALLAPRVIGA